MKRMLAVAVLFLAVAVFPKVAQAAPELEMLPLNAPSAEMMAMAAAQVAPSLSYFYVATAAGTNASSGVVTVLVDGAASTITCTIGTGTTCSDLTHTVSLTDGQRVSIQFTTQAADTLAGVKAFVHWN